MGGTPSAAITARTLEELEKHIEPIKGISGVDFKKNKTPKKFDTS